VRLSQEHPAGLAGPPSSAVNDGQDLGRSLPGRQQVRCRRQVVGAVTRLKIKTLVADGERHIAFEHVDELFALVDGDPLRSKRSFVSW